MAYSFIHESSEVDEGAIIGEDTCIWRFCCVRRGAKIGSHTNIGQGGYIDCGAVVGNYVKIGNNVSVYNKVTIEDGVFCGASVVFTNVKVPRSMYPQEVTNYKETIVKEGSSIGANSTIICGNTIGRYAMVAAGSVVTHDVPDYALVAGVPARIVGKVDEKGHIIERYE